MLIYKEYFLKIQIFHSIVKKILLFSGALILVVNLTILSYADSSLNVPLKVSNPLDIDRYKEPVTIGIPVPQELNIANTHNLRVTTSDSQATVHAQFRILSRWGELADKTRPIRWVLVDFQADVSAKGKAVYYLTTIESGSEKDLIMVDEPEGISVSEDEAKIVVDTGNLE